MTFHHDESEATPSHSAGLTDVELLEVRLADELEHLETKLDTAFVDLEQRGADLDRRETDLQQRAHLLAIQESKTRLQRRRIAEELRAQRAELGARSQQTPSSAVDPIQLEELKRSQEDLRRELRLQRDLADEALNDAAGLRERLAAAEHNDSAPSDDAQQLKDELAVARDELETLRREHSVADEETREVIVNLKTQLAERLEEIESLGDQLAAQGSGDDVGQPASGQPDLETGGEAESGFDWEAQKRLLMQHMGGEAEDAEEQLAVLERASDVVDSAQGADSEEVALLRRQLTDLMTALASDGGEGFDFAAALEEERAKLKAIQEEWHEKLRQSELEISIERAKLAREKVKLEDELRLLQEEKDRLATISQPETKGDSTTSSGRWMARLGLTDNKE